MDLVLKANVLSNCSGDDYAIRCSETVRFGTSQGASYLLSSSWLDTWRWMEGAGSVCYDASDLIRCRILSVGLPKRRGFDTPSERVRRGDGNIVAASLHLNSTPPTAYEMVPC